MKTKNSIGALCIGLGLCAGAVLADTGAISVKLAGGCFSSNTTKSCTVRVAASGDAASGTVVLQHASSRSGSFRTFTAERSLTNGATSFRFRNSDGCYRAVTGRNGDDKRDVASNTVCEK